MPSKPRPKYATLKDCLYGMQFLGETLCVLRENVPKWPYGTGYTSKATWRLSPSKKDVDKETAEKLRHYPQVRRTRHASDPANMERFEWAKEAPASDGQEPHS